MVETDRTPRNPLVLHTYGYPYRDGPPRSLSDLTPRHREVALLTSEGYTTQVIGERMGIKPESVKKYLLVLYEVLRFPAVADGMNPRVLLTRWVLTQSNAGD